MCLSHCLSPLLVCLLLVSGSSQGTLTSPSAHAGPKHSKKKKNKNAQRCVNFEQSLGSDEESVELSLSSHCGFEVICSLEWELRCEGAPGAEEFSKRSRLEVGERWDVLASASTCSEGDWQVDRVRWTCRPEQ